MEWIMAELLKIGVPKELKAGERRVSTTPDTVTKLKKLGFDVLIEAGAGQLSNFADKDYEQAGAKIIANAAMLWKEANIILKINVPTDGEVDLLQPGQVLASFIWPAQNDALVKKLAAKKISVLGLESIPRISRAQKMDVLSSMANIAGYRAIVEAASLFGRFFTGQITAAGRVPPAKVLVIGAGVAGLSAIGTSKSLGAIVRAFDTRPAAKEQVESMGAEFLLLEFKEDGTGQGGYAKTMSKEFIDAEMALFAEQAKEVDIIVTTALIPGRPAPKLITKEMVASMRPGSVIVDLASEQGGNCEYTEPGSVVTKHGVSVVGYTDLPSRLPTQASQLLGTNLVHLLSDMTKGPCGFRIDLEDEVIRGALITHEGVVTWPAPAPKVLAQPVVKAAAAAGAHGAKGHGQDKPSGGRTNMFLLGFALIFFLLGQSAPATFLAHFSIFILAVIIGWQVVWNVTPALHTPLMSVTNAISGIIIIGAIVQITGLDGGLATILAGTAAILASINVAGGFLVTNRMLKMFQK
jgi:NAD(P) transhydrogenase subunit alpha